MGSSSSIPVKQAKRVEVEHHNDLFEVRLDHMAMSGALILLILLLIAIFLLMRRRRLRFQRRQLQAQGFPLQPWSPRRNMLPHFPLHQGVAQSIPMIWHVDTDDIVKCARAMNSCRSSPRRNERPYSPPPAREPARVEVIHDNNQEDQKVRAWKE